LNVFDQDNLSLQWTGCQIQIHVPHTLDTSLHKCMRHIIQNTNLCRSRSQIRGGKDAVKKLGDVFRPCAHGTDLHLTAGFENLVKSKQKHRSVHPKCPLKNDGIKLFQIRTVNRRLIYFMVPQHHKQNRIQQIH